MLKIPSKLTIVLGLVDGLLIVLNTTTFKLGPPWQTGINIALIAIPAMGIGPLLGSAWRAALDLKPQEAAIITAALTFLQLWQQSEPLSTTLHAVIAGVIAVAGSLGFAPQVINVVQAERAQRRVRRG